MDLDLPVEYAAVEAVASEEFPDKPRAEAIAETTPTTEIMEAAFVDEPVVETEAGTEVLEATFVDERAVETPLRNDVLEAAEFDAAVEPRAEAAPVGFSKEAAPAGEPVREIRPRADRPEAKGPVKVDLLDAIRSAEAQKAAEFVKNPPRGKWRIPAAIAAGLVLTAAAALTLVARRAEAARRHASPAVVTEVLAATPAATASPAPPPAAPGAAAAQATPSHHAQMKITRTTWVTIVADGGKPFQGLLRKGSVRDIDFSNDATLRLGSPGGVELTLDGAPVALLKRGVRLLQITPDGVSFPEAPSQD